MELLERYLQAVGRYLPEGTRIDTMAELRANLLEHMDAREEELGRELNSGDVCVILKEHGKPEAVALRYLPQRSLIGPAVFPFYVFTLKKLLPLVVLVYAVAQGVTLIFTMDQGDVAGRIVVAVLKLVPVLLISAASVTLGFVLVEWAISRGELKDTLSQWDPMKLPAVKHEAAAGVKVKSQAVRIVELCAHCLWMAYVLVIPRHPFWLIGPGVFYLYKLDVSFAPVWHVFYVLLVVLTSVQLVMRLLALSRRFDTWMQPMEVATDVLGFVALVIVASAKEWLVAAGPGTDLHQLAVVNHWIGMALRLALPVVALGSVNEGWKWWKRRAPVKSLAF